jgi:hypothetical protein
MYLNGCVNYAGGGVIIFSLADPEHPAFVSQYTAGNYIHDCFVRKDTMYAAAIYDVGVEIVDVTDKSYPALLATITYPGSGTHNCAVSSDGGYLLTTDEINATEKTLKFWDIRSLPSYSMVAEYTGNPSTVVHNVFVRDSLAFLSHYTLGMRVINISDPTSPFEIGGYDTCPDSLASGGAFTGAWSVYPYFPSGKVIIGDMLSGLFVVDLGEAPTAVRDGAPLPGGFALEQNYPNPFNPTTTITYALDAAEPVSLIVYDLLGSPVATLRQGDEQAGTHQVRWNGTDDRGRRVAGGVYFYRLAAGGRSIAKPLVLLP